MLFCLFLLFAFSLVPDLFALANSIAYYESQHGTNRLALRLICSVFQHDLSYLGQLYVRKVFQMFGTLCI